MTKTYAGSCHCGAVRFACELNLAQGTSKCNCSICVKTRFWKAIVTADAFRLLQGEDALTDYQFGSHTLHHFFCRRCGVKPFGHGHLDAPGGDFYAVNVACLDNVTPRRSLKRRSALRTAGTTSGRRRPSRPGTCSGMMNDVLARLEQADSRMPADRRKAGARRPCGGRGTLPCRAPRRADPYR